jgi:hypothetical protein
VYAYLAELWPEIRIDERRTWFEIHRLHEHEVDLGQSPIPLILMPSTFAWPHSGLSCSDPDRRTAVAS